MARNWVRVLGCQGRIQSPCRQAFPNCGPSHTLLLKYLLFPRLKTFSTTILMCLFCHQQIWKFFHSFFGHLWPLCELSIHGLCTFSTWQVPLLLIDLQSLHPALMKSLNPDAAARNAEGGFSADLIALISPLHVTQANEGVAAGLEVSSPNQELTIFTGPTSYLSLNLRSKIHLNVSHGLALRGGGRTVPRQPLCNSPISAGAPSSLVAYLSSELKLCISLVSFCLGGIQDQYCGCYLATRPCL